MRLKRLQVVNFRGLNFEHTFKDNFVVLTGVNGSGKSTIIESIELLLSQRTNQFDEQRARQITAETATFEIEIEAEDGEVNHLAERMQKSSHISPSLEVLTNEITTKLFIDNTFKRKIVVKHPKLGWKADDPDYIKEFINDQPVPSMDSFILPNYFTVFSTQVLLKIDQLENINLQYSPRNSRQPSGGDIFNASNNNIAQRLSRTTVSASPLLDSLLVYGEPDETQLFALIDEYEKILEPISFSIQHLDNGTSQIGLSRDGKNIFSVDSASSGQKKAIALATLKFVWAHLTIKPIVLLDEPETSMHPDMVNRTFKALADLVEGSEKQPSFVIATHSAEIVDVNAKHAYRIVLNHDRSSSTLSKIEGLLERTEVLDELGIRFNLDYLVSKIIFVEGSAHGNSHGLNDADTYQYLLDPTKDRMLFVECGSKIAVKKRYEFEIELMKRLGQAPHTYSYLIDGDGSTDSPNKTPFWDVEYIYLSNPSVLADCANKVLGEEKFTTENILALYPTDKKLEEVKTKDIFESFKNYNHISTKNMVQIQKNVLNELRNDPDLMTTALKEFISRFSDTTTSITA